MIKNKLDFKLINIALIAVICFFIYQASPLWLGILDKALKIVLPLFAGFVIAYALYPILESLEEKKIPKGLGIGIILVTLIAIIVTIIILLIPLLSTQIVSLIDSLIIFIKDITTNFNIDLGNLGDTLFKTFNEIISNVGKYVSDGAVKTINASINVVSNIFIALASGIYFLIDMDKIRIGIKKYLSNKSDKFYKYISLLDYEIRNYIKGFLTIVLISFFEYTLLYYIIGHPNALLLGILSALGNFIPYFGGIFVQVIGVVTGFTLNPSLGISVIIATLISSSIDSYILNPLVYGKSNQVHPIIVIAAVFGGGILFGFIGIIIALPLSIMLISSLKFYKEEINIKKGN
mgnify:CR=1 FL=1